MTRGHTTSVRDAYVAIHCGTLAVCWYSHREMYLLWYTVRMVPYVGTYTEKCINCGLFTFTAKHNKSLTLANTVVWCTVWLHLKVRKNTVYYISLYIAFHCNLHFTFDKISLHITFQKGGIPAPPPQWGWMRLGQIWLTTHGYCTQIWGLSLVLVTHSDSHTVAKTFPHINKIVSPECETVYLKQSHVSFNFPFRTITSVSLNFFSLKQLHLWVFPPTYFFLTSCPGSCLLNSACKPQYEENEQS